MNKLKFEFIDSVFTEIVAKIENELNEELNKEKEFANGNWNLTCQYQGNGFINWFNCSFYEMSLKLNLKILNTIYEKIKNHP